MIIHLVEETTVTDLTTGHPAIIPFNAQCTIIVNDSNRAAHMNPDVIPATFLVGWNGITFELPKSKFAETR